MFTRTHTPARPAVPPTQATSFAALFMGSLMLAMRGVMSHRMLRLASLALLAPLGLMGLMPAATFAASPSTTATRSAAASVHISLAYDAAAALTPGMAFTYSLSVTNAGPGVARNTWVALPLDANVVVDDFSSGDSGIFVQSLDASAINIKFGDLNPNTTATVLISAHVMATAPQTLALDSRATATWDDGNAGNTVVSNNLVIGAGATTATAGPAQTLQVVADGPVDAGTTLTINGSFYGSKEGVSFWINAPTGISIAADSLGQSDSALQGNVIALDAPGYSDGDGMLTYTLNTSGLPSGTYSLVGHGLTSGVEGVASFTIK